MNRVVQPVAALQPCCEEMERIWGYEEEMERNDFGSNQVARKPRKLCRPAVEKCDWLFCQTGESALADSARRQDLKIRIVSLPGWMAGWVVPLQEIQTGCCQLKSEFKIWGSFTARQSPAYNITGIFPHLFYSTKIKAKFAIPDKTCVCNRYKSRQVISLSLICLKPSSTPTNSNRVRPQVLKWMYRYDTNKLTN